MRTRTLSKMILASMLIAAPALAGVSAQDPAERAEAAVDEIITMRSTLAREFIKPGVEVSEETFKKVCGSVGMRVRQISEKEGMKIRHAATKNRNAQNAADEREAALIKKFEEDRNLTEVREEIQAEGKNLIRYTRPIFVEKACLACHGEKDSRPGFIKTKYPDDKAFGFKEGDLRGIISATVPIQ